jgi:hypothetical protein
MVIISSGLGYKNDSTGEPQQQFTRHSSSESVLSYIVSSRYVETTIEQTDDFTYSVIVATLNA